ncbi:MAG TPA: VOC family protein [Candidatus Binataceae bacterium]|nr:VOC family protein [Candidatus Binataceae bacterium]
MIRPERIGHVVIKVRNLERSRKFYAELLGLQLMHEMPQIKMAFLASNGRDHHEIGLVEVGDAAPPPQKGETGLLHIAFRLRDEDHLKAAFRELKENNVEIVSTVDHGITKSIYFRDPDGHQLEVYCDNSKEYMKALGKSYDGMNKLDFAPDEPGLRDSLSRMMR